MKTDLEIYEHLNLRGHLNDNGKDHYIGLLKRKGMDDAQDLKTALPEEDLEAEIKREIDKDYE